MMKRFFVNIVISGLLAFLFLTIICSFYYNVPVHSPNSDNATDYVWEKNTLYIDFSEGYGFGKTNNEGFMNKIDYLGQDVDILFMGSSHTEGMNINQKYNVVSILNKDLENIFVYNISVAGHNIKICLDNLSSAIEKYNPEIIIIETNSIILDSDTIDKIINDQIKDIKSSNSKIINILQSNPFLRLTYTQINSFLQTQQADEATSSNSDIVFDLEANKRLMTYICDSIGNKKLIILYHPTISFDKNDDLLINDNREAISSFKTLCDENNIYFIDMSDSFIRNYEKRNILPYGFSNTSIGEGHFNKDGHLMMAEEIEKVLKEVD